jgi:hypothetical protein
MSANRRQARRLESVNVRQSTGTASRGGTGPRTITGKERSKYNALKQGLFSQVVVLNHESRTEFEGVLCGLRRDLKPEGLLEQTLVEKIATILWRYRRLLQAESANVQKNMETKQDMDKGITLEVVLIEAELERVKAETCRIGLLPKIDDSPESLQRCLQKLYDVREAVQTYGLERSRNETNLGVVYGARYSGRPGNDLFDYYLKCLEALRCSAAERAAKGFESEIDCERKFMAETEKEISRLEGLRKDKLQESPQTNEDRLKRAEVLRLAIPESSQLDRLLRSEASLDRAFDRALIQLQRLQHLRKSQKTIEQVGTCK